VTMDRSRYPKNWNKISRQIREAAGQRCEQCGAPNYAAVARNEDGTPHVLSATEIEILNTAGDEDCITRIVLTVAHIGAPKPDGSPGDKHDKMDCRRENLRALCQRCHLALDLDDHIRHAAATRRRKRILLGQIEIFL
jgi:hypothetical protein